MTPPDNSYSCAWCELEIGPRERPIRLSNSQPPWTWRSASGAIAAAGRSYAAVLRSMSDVPEITLWFHRSCWDKFLALLQGR